MIRDWLRSLDRTETSYGFKVTDLTEANSPPLSDDLVSWLALQLLQAHTNVEHLKRRYHARSAEELTHYINTHLFRAAKTPLEENVLRGEWGEVISGLVLRDFRNLSTSLVKLRYKLNRTRATFGIDVFGIESNANKEVVALYICEAKTRIKYDKHVGREAHDSLILHDTAAIVTIADFMSNVYYEARDWDMVDQFDQIVRDQSIATNQEIFLLCERDLWNEEILEELQSVPNRLPNLTVNVILVNQLDHVYRDSTNRTSKVAEEMVYGS